ncbi:centrosomal protein of 78 kDa [Hetaerina americana]|uniref:centrosomal protein of 78 kDa n=1 Tax=Hetaerina americana TaxID=62018 RepID=UPI003A7F482E
MCQHYNLLPLSKVKGYLHKNVLDLPADRIRIEDWRPLLETLQSDQGLQKIAIRSAHRGQAVVEFAGTKEKAARTRKCPVIFTAYVLHKLIASMVKCLSINNNLIHLELQGIPLTFKYLDALLEGISKCKTLKFLSFIDIPFGDDGTGRVCRVLRHLPNVASVNFTACGLTPLGMQHIANLIKTQKIKRFVETWQQSLRYQRPNLDSLWGLRQITLNTNPLIGDEGMKILLEGLEDDLWIKGIEMSGCGLGIGAAKELISFLQNSYAISVIDIRGNKGVPVHLIQHIMLLLAKKTMHYRSEYQWNSWSSTSHQPMVQSRFLGQTTEKLRNQQRSRTKELDDSSVPMRGVHTSTIKQKQCCQAQSKLKS